MEKLGNVFTLIRNGASIKQADGSGGYPVTRIETIANREIDRNKFGYAGINDLGKYRDYLLTDGDILMSHINSEKHLGKVALYHPLRNEHVIHGMNLLILRVDAQLLIPAYAFYFFNSNAFLRQIPNITKKSVNQASFTVTALKELEIPLPPLDEQRHIAAILDKVSRLISLRKKQLQKLHELIKARFVELFGNPVLNDKGWKQKSLGSVTTKIGSGATPKGGKEAYQEEGITLVRSMNVHNGKFEYRDLAHISDEQAAKLDNVTIEENDVLLNITGASVARSCVVPTEILPARVNQHVCIIRCKECITPEFLNKLLIDDNYQDLLWSIAGSGATREAITKQQVESLQIVLPPMELQEQFAAFVKQTDKSKVVVQKALDEAQTLFDSLMQEYFR